MNKGLERRSPSSGSAGRPLATRATSRVASASGSRSPRSPSPNRTCSSWTSPLVGSTLSGKRRWATGSWPTPRPERPCCSRLTTATSQPTAGSDFVFQEHKPSRRSAPLASRVAALSAGIALALAAWAALDPARGGLATLLAAVAVLVAGFAWLEGGTVSARDLTLVATLGGLAAAGRVLFAPVPSVQPVTVIVAAAGVALGPRRGFAVGALAAIASNFFLGQGPHTPWQMLAWGGCGLAAGLLRPLLRRRLAFVAFVLVLGFAFGTLMALWLWLAFYPPTAPARLARRGAGVPFNVAHATGNVVLALVAGPELRRVLERFERRSRTEVVWA